eukprot:m51a1_g5799 hypothetical protein (764) ;mRNA; f:72328-75757
MMQAEGAVGLAQAPKGELEEVEVPQQRSPQATEAEAPREGALRRCLSFAWFLIAFYGSFLLVGVTQESMTLMWYVIAFSLASSLGQLAVYWVVSKYDSLTCSIAAALRKFLVLVLSIVWFRHSVSLPQWLCILLVFAGITFEVIFAKDGPLINKRCIVWVSFVLIVSSVLVAQVFSIALFMPLSMGGVDLGRRFPTRAALVGNAQPAAEPESALLFVWAAPDRPLPAPMRQTIAAEASRAMSPGALHVFCASSQCLEFAASFGAAVSVSRLRLADYADVHSPLELWFRRTSALKFHLSSQRFSNALQAAAEAAVLYERGGTLVSVWGATSPAISVPPRPSDADASDLLCADVSAGAARVVWAPAKHDRALLDGMREFNDAFPEYTSEATGRDYPYVRPSCHAVPFAAAKRVLVRIEELEEGPSVPAASRQRKYGALWYDVRVNKVLRRTLLANLGDEVQTLAGAQWLPRVDTLVERDDLNASTPSVAGDPPGSVTMFMNAWWGFHDMNWPPPEYIKPVLLSMHVTAGLASNFSQPSWRDYMVRHGPVGARDTSTLELWRSLGVPAFLSSCMTLTLQRPLPRGVEAPNCTVLISDVARSALAVLPKHVRRSACHITANAKNVSDGNTRVSKAFANLRAIAAARLVVTSRLHVALPAVAMGTPTILVLTEEMPGGGGRHERNAYSRFGGSLSLVHVYEKKRRAAPALLDFDWESPPPNPGAEQLQATRCRFLRHVYSYNGELFDSMLFFDIDHIFDACMEEYPGI